MKKKKADPIDYDGMGDFSRFNDAFDNGKSLENLVKSWLKKKINGEQDQKK